jgi:hypothetical protein
MSKERYYGFYSTGVYLPLSALSRCWRNFWRRKLGKRDQFMQDTCLPTISWRRCTPTQPVRLYEFPQENGNVHLSELGILAQFAASCPAGKNIFEIGTFDGRTTLNLAINSHNDCQVFTLDLPAATDTRYELAPGEGHFVDKPEPGMRYKKNLTVNQDAVSRIIQLLGDSAEFDFSPFAENCSLIFVDGSHSFDYAMSDTNNALKMVAGDGVILWHDYGVWEGVTRALEQIEREKKLGLRNIRGTSLVYWRKGGSKPL